MTYALVFCCCAAFVQTNEGIRPKLSPNASTRLFIRTIPKGATILLDGQQLPEKTDGLLLLPEGVYQITLQLDGYDPVRLEVPLHKGRITRIERKLTALAVMPADDSSEASTEASQSAGDWLKQQTLPAGLLEAMQTVLRQHPADTRWSGQRGQQLFAIATKQLPASDIRSRATPTMLELVHMLAVHELLKAKSLLDQFAELGLSDATTLRQAVEHAAGQLRVTGRVEGLEYQAAVHQDIAVAYVFVDYTSLSAHLQQPAELDVVRTAYRDVMHQQAAQLMEQENWSDALLLWRHLHQRQLVSQQLYLDAARCFQKLEQNQDAIRVLTEALETFKNSESSDFFEKAGDVLLELDDDRAQQLAEDAYLKAIDNLKDTMTGSDQN